MVSEAGVATDKDGASSTRASAFFLTGAWLVVVASKHLT